MKCSKCDQENQDFVQYCVNCGNTLNSESTTKEENNQVNTTNDNVQHVSELEKQHKTTINDVISNNNSHNSLSDEEKINLENRDIRFSVNMSLVFLIGIPFLFVAIGMQRGIDFGELIADMNIGALSFIVLILSLYLAFFIKIITLKLRSKTFEESKTYPINDFFLDAYKFLNLGNMKRLPTKVGYTEVSSVSILNAFGLALLLAMTVFNSVWGFPYKFIILLVFSLITVVIYLLFTIVPDKLSFLIKEDVRSEEGYKKYFLISTIPFALTILGIVIHVTF